LTLSRLLRLTAVDNLVRFTFLVILLMPACLWTQTAPANTPEQARRDLIVIEQKIGRANLECDYDYFRQIEADDFIFTDARGGVTTTQEALAGEKDCHKFAGTYDLDQTEVRFYGNVAVVTARVTIDGTSREGKPVHRLSRFTDVFVWRDNRWQIVAGHSSRIPETAK
jgi:ketosteroid isomerase-like protein